MKNKNKMYDILVLEPVLDDRKSIALLFQSQQYNLNFVDKANEVNSYLKAKIPHILILNIDKNIDSGLLFVQKLINQLPEETIIFIFSKNPESVKLRNSLEHGVNSIIAKPVAGMSVIEAIRAKLYEQNPLSMKFVDRKKIVVKMTAKLIGMGETDFIVESPLDVDFGTKLNIVCPLVDEIISARKTFVVSKNKHEHLNSQFKYCTLTVLGLKNDELKRVRSKILRWDKL